MVDAVSSTLHSRAGVAENLPPPPSRYRSLSMSSSAPIGCTQRHAPGEGHHRLACWRGCKATCLAFNAFPTPIDSDVPRRSRRSLSCFGGRRCLSNKWGRPNLLISLFCDFQTPVQVRREPSRAPKLIKETPKDGGRGRRVAAAG